MPKTAADPSGLLVALVSFDGGLGDLVLRVHKGDLIEAGHPAVKKWPDLFGPVDVRFRAAEPRIEQATAAPGQKRGA